RSRVELPVDLIGSVVNAVATAPQRRVSWFAPVVPALAAAGAVAAVVAVALLLSQRAPSVGPAPFSPTPTTIPEDGGLPIDVVWDNRSEQSLVLTMAEDGALTAYALVEPCSVHNMIVDVSGPFTIGLGPGGQPIEEPAPTIYDSAQADEAANELLVRIESNGAVSVEPSSSVATFIPSGNCPAGAPDGVLLEPGDSVEVPAVDTGGRWGTIHVERGEDRGGYEDAEIPDDMFVIELYVRYEVERLPDPQQFGSSDWSLRPTDVDAEHFFLIEPTTLTGVARGPGGPQPSLGVYPGAIDVFTTPTEGWIIFAVPRREANLELELLYSPASDEGVPAEDFVPAARFIVREPGPPPRPAAAVTPSPAPGAPVYVEKDGLPFTVIDSPAADELFERTDTCTNPEDGYTVTFPDDWYTNTEIGDVPACTWFTPEFFEVTDPNEAPDEIWVSIGVIDGTIGYIGTTIGYHSEELTVAGLAGRRMEFNSDPNGDPSHRTYHYVFPLQEAPNERTFAATTDTDWADDYELARAVLDRMMATLQFE
ncbi:MAG: hypothetical protein M3295_06780, partial [Chloroflexota bacterium]|nr:hypothetical protein [Chloroflexota bacterium]